MHESVTHEDDGTESEGGRCPVPEWALRPLAFVLPALGVAVALWLLFLR